VTNEYSYAIEFQTEGGRWVRLARFRSPLDADRAFELLLAAGVRRPLQLIRFRIIAESQPPEEA
jgi:hypothetical protein